MPWPSSVSSPSAQISSHSSIYSVASKRSQGLPYSPMSTFIHRSTILLIVLVVALVGCSAELPKPILGVAVAQEVATNATTTRELQTYSSTRFQTLMLTAVNKQRTANGLSTLCMNKKLQTAAQGHSTEMATKNYMAHTSYDGTTMSKRITASGYKWSACAENVAAGQTTVDAVMTAWMASSGHKANILSSKYTHFGCGYAYSSSSTYKHYWTQDFGYGSTETCS